MSITAVFYDIITVLMSLIIAVGGISSPSTADVIETLNGNANLTMFVTSDTQLADYTVERDKNVYAAVQDMLNSNCTVDAFLCSGDIGECGFQSEYDRVYDYLIPLRDNGIVDNFIFALGNHDTRYRDIGQVTERFLALQNSFNSRENAVNTRSFAYKVNGYTVISLSTDVALNDYQKFSEDTFQWVNEVLADAAKDGKPVFVINHFPFDGTHGIPEDDDDETMGADSERFRKIFDKYDNVFYFCGHTHKRFSDETVEKVGNFYSINVPALFSSGCGFFVEVTDNEVLIRGRDFSTGEWRTDAEYSFELK